LIYEKRIVFEDLFEGKKTRNLLIATFLAVLEIVRGKLARVVQDQQFGDIFLERREEEKQEKG